jgi:hypothetical protein
VNIWNDRIEEVLNDPKKRRLAAAMFWSVDFHLKDICKIVHKRQQCQERFLMVEATIAVEFADTKIRVTGGS